MQGFVGQVWSVGYKITHNVGRREEASVVINDERELLVGVEIFNSYKETKGTPRCSLYSVYTINYICPLPDILYTPFPAFNTFHAFDYAARSDFYLIMVSGFC